MASGSPAAQVDRPEPEVLPAITPTEAAEPVTSSLPGVVWRGNPRISSFLVPVESLVLDPANVRKHSEKNLSAIAGSLVRSGQQVPIVIDDRNVVRAGNARLTEARKLGWTHLAAVVSDLTSETALVSYAITDNRTSELASWEFEALSSQLNALAADGENLLELGWEQHELDLFSQAKWTPPEPGPDPEPGTSRDNGRTLTFSDPDWAVLEEASVRVREETGQPDLPLAACVSYLAGVYLSPE